MYGQDSETIGPQTNKVFLPQRRCLTGLVIIVWLLIIPDLHGAPLVPKRDFSKIHLGHFLEILADPEGTWTLANVMQQPLAEQFVSARKMGLNFGHTDTIYWARLTLKNSDPQAQKWYLQYTNPQLDEITLFAPTSDGQTYQKKTVGNIHPISNRDVRHPLFTFRIEIPAEEEMTIYFRLNSNGKLLIMSMLLWSEQAFIDDGTTSHTKWYAHLGIFLMSSFCGVLLFLILRDRNYAYYALFTLFSSAVTVCQKGFDDLWLWSIPGDKGHYGFVLFLTGVTVVYLLFIRSLLKLPRYFPLGDRIVKAFLALLTLWVLLIWIFPRPLHLQIITFFQIPTLLLALGVSIIRCRQQYQPAFFVAGGAGVMLIASLIIKLITAGLLGNKAWIDTSIAVGRLTEMLLLLMALASAYRSVLREKEEAQTQATQLKERIVKELKHADQMKDEFLANVSHELRTPLHGIMGLCSNALDSMPQLRDSTLGHNLELIFNSTLRLAHLVDDLLDFSKIKNDELQLHLQKIELQSAIRLSQQLCQPLIGDKPIRLQSTLPEEPIWVQADENRLQQILLNLLGNAIKFTHQGAIEIHVISKEKEAEIRVKDTGIGIASERQEQIFQSFFQVEGSSSREYGGVGLGLAITRQLVELLRGELNLESELNQGSTFIFTLPLYEASAAELSSEIQQTVQLSTSTLSSELVSKYEPLTDFERAGLPRKNGENAPLILVVDDELLNVKVLRDILEKNKFRVESASDGELALEMIRKQMPELVLLDVMMPRLNGYETCQQIRQMYSEAELPVIMQTAKGHRDDHIEGLRAGANDYLIKPFQSEELLARVGSQLQQKLAGETLAENKYLQLEVKRIRQIEGSLRLSQKRLEKLLDVGNEALLAVDEKGCIIFSNQVVETWLGYPAATLLGQPVGRLIPPHCDSHPLRFSWSELQQEKSTLHYTYVVLQNVRSEQWEGQMWQTLLELEEVIYVITLGNLQQDDLTMAMAPDWIEALHQNRLRIQQVIDILTDLHPAKLKSQPHLLKELNHIDEALARLAQAKPDQNPEQRFRIALVDVMNKSVSSWEKATHTSVIELAEESGLWKVYVEENRVRVRVLERYLDLKQLPKNPRWRTVIQTANFVLSRSSLSSEARIALESPLNRLIQLVHQRNLS